MRVIAEAIGYILGCVWGVFFGFMMLIVGLGGISLIPLGLIALFINPGIGVLMIIAGAVAIGRVGKGRSR